MLLNLLQLFSLRWSHITPVR